MRIFSRFLVASLLLGFTAVAFPPPASPHCEIPCGIYGDKMRVDMIEEDLRTIEKSMKEIEALSAQEEKNYNQIVRWVQNKEHHADKVSHVVTQYFMTQRIMPVEDRKSKAFNLYLKELSLLHEMLVYAMKAKQTTDLENVEKLRSLLKEFSNLYFHHHGKHP